MATVVEGLKGTELEEFCRGKESEWRETCEQVLQEATTEWIPSPDDAWTLQKTVEDCRIYSRKYKDSSYFQMKAVKTVKTTRTAEEFIRFVYRCQDCAELEDWYHVYDPGNVYYRNVFRFDPYFNFAHVRTSSGSFIVWDRDLMDLRMWHKNPGNPNETFYYGKSVDSLPSGNEPYAELPTDSKCVRAFLVGGFCSHAVKNPDTDELTYTYYLHANASGWVPTWIYNKVLFKKGFCVSTYLDMFMKFEDPAAIEEQDRPAVAVLDRLLQEELEFEGGEDEGEVEIVEEIVEEIVYVDEDGQEVDPPDDE